MGMIKSGYTRKLFAILMIVILLTPNVYCFEDTESNDSGTVASSQTESDVILTEDSFSTNEDSSNIEVTDDTYNSENTVILSSISPPTEDPEIVIAGATNYLNPSLENNMDNHDTSLFTGSFIYTYPIETVRGKAGLEPKVSLTYSSSMGLKGTHGSVGMGWSLNENCIVRDARFTPENVSDDRFILILDGSTYELIYVEEDNSYHTEVESFLLITENTTNTNSYGDFWIVKDVDGTSYRFGYTNASEQTNSVESRNYVSKWWLDLVEDVNGNQIIYNYIENPISGEVGSTYLNNITYNNGTSSIDFDFIEKPNTFSLYEHGNNIKEKSLVSNIIISNNESFLWNYTLEYENMNSKSFLVTILKTGLNNQSFPSTSFEYDMLNDWGSTGSWNPPTHFSYEGMDRGLRLADVNGDGLADLIQGYENSGSNGEYHTWLNTGTGWSSASSSWNPPTHFSYGGRDRGLRLADLNGDGLVDLIQGYETSGTEYDEYHAWFNTGTGWSSASSSWNPPTHISFYGKDMGVRLADINGDGLVDIVQGYYNSGGTYRAWLNTGNGWSSAPSSWNPPTHFSQGGIDRGLRLADLNGDGLVDLIQGYENDGPADEYHAWLNTGNGWSGASGSWNSPTHFSYDGEDGGLRLADVNGDGLVDLIQGYYRSELTSRAWLNTGNGWSSTGSWNPPTHFSYEGTKDRGLRLADLNGDGLVDLIQGYYASGETYLTWINTNRGANPPSVNYNTPCLMTNIHHSIGANTTVNYVPSTTFDNTGNDSISDLPLNVWIVSQIIRDNGITDAENVITTTNYSYKDGMQYYDTPEEIEFRGFGEVSVENNYSITKHTFHQDDILKGIKNHTEVWDKDGNIYSESDMEYSSQEIHPDVNLILLDSESTTQYDGLVQSSDSSAGWTSFTEYEEYDSYGNPLSIINHGDFNVSGDERYIHYEYVNEEDSWIIGLKTHEWLEDSNNVNKSESWYYYDESIDNSNITKGQLTKTVSWNDMGDNPSVLYDYDNYGNIVVITDPRGHSESIGYDENHVYPVSIENSLGQKEFYDYNDFGRITKITDSNGILTEYVYDELHRIVKVVKPYDNSTSPSIEYTYNQDGVAPETINTSIKESNQDVNLFFHSIDSYDGFGQLIQNMHEGENNWITQNTTYNELGLVKNVEVPHYLNESALSVTYEYETIGRPKVITNTDNTTITYCYELDNTTITNQNGINKTLKSDVFGNIVKVYEFNEGETYVTSYIYDAMDNLIEIKLSSPATDYHFMRAIGDGTESNPFRIYNIYDLQAMNGNLSAHYILMNDIDASETSLWNNGAGFLPVGNSSSNSFTGKLDGQNYTISNLSINRPSESYIGLFGYAKGAEITNLKVYDANVEGYMAVSTVAGYMTNDNNHLENVHSSGDVECNYYIGGGLVGYYSNAGNSIIQDCSSDTNVIGGYYVGSFTGANTGSNITDCYSTGSVSGSSSSYTGGFVGYSSGVITNCYSTGAINSLGGGFAGLSSSGTYNSCYWDTETSGKTTSGGGTGKTTTQMQLQSTFAGWDFEDTWVMWEYPILKTDSKLIPHEIYNIADLQAMSNDLSAYYILMNDIDASETSLWNNGAGFLPVGNSSSTPFTGKLDGQNYTISNLSINRPSESYIGLFGYVKGAEIINLKVHDADIKGRQDVSTVAGYVGSNNNHIENVHSSGDVECIYFLSGGLIGFYQDAGNSIIRNCSSNANVTGGDDFIGGFVGAISEANITDCYSTGSASGPSSYTGGFSGSSWESTITNCYSTGAVSSSGGGFLGFSSTGTFNSCYWDTETSGRTTSGGGTGKTTAQMQTQSTFIGWDFVDTWVMQGYPELCSKDFTYPLGSEQNPYKVYNVSDLQEMYNDLSAHYVLMNDIDASETSLWNNGAGFSPVGNTSGSFTGKLDGQNYTISNLYINRSSGYYVGLFGRINGAEIINLKVYNANIKGDQCVSTVVGSAQNANTHIENVHSSGNVECNSNGGGLLGYCDNVDTRPIRKCSSNTNVTGDYYVGGFIGANSDSNINDCYSTGSVSGDASWGAGGFAGYSSGVITNCYSVGNVTDLGGGFVALQSSGTCNSCYWDTETSGKTTSGGGTGMTTAQMQTQSTFVGWDFEDTWLMQGYPKLKFGSSILSPSSVGFTYDSLGRKISMSDPDMGNWTYEYDLNGNLINQTDARGVSVILSYDALNRVTAIDYLNDDDVSFTYDHQFNGTLSQVTKGNVSSSYDYDLYYRVLNETVIFDTTDYTTSYNYDSMDRATRVTYPDDVSVNLTYNAQTLLESVEGVVDNLDYNARNQITTKELSNGVVTTYTYDTEKLLLNRIYTESLQDLNYDFDNVGNILEIEDNVMNSVKTYGYDDLDRLTSADMSVNSVPTYQRDFTYDQYGSIRQVNENYVTISSYSYNLTPFHAPVTYNGNDLDYDANGNLIEDEDFIYVYNDANQLSEVRYAGNSSLVEKYWYDANGQRVKKQNSAGEFTYYINKFYEVDDGTATSYFFRDDERIAKETAGDMEWYLSDHLGSTTLLINESGLEVERTEYYPYGEVQSGGLEKYGFTGQENDASTKLMYYGARYYSPEYRVFVQPDTMLPDVYNPQALNRYAYALNNPVKYTDPSGHYVESGIDIAFLAMDINDIRTGNADKWTYIGLATDVACLALPGVTGGRIGVKAVEEGVTHADNVGDLFNLMDTTFDAEKRLDNVIDAEKTMDTLDDSLQVKDYVLKANSKAEAKDAVNDLPPEIRAKVKDFYNGGSNKYTEFTLQKTENGNYLATMTKPGNVIGSYATYYKEISPSGDTLNVYKETIDPFGNLVHTKNKMGK